MKKLSIAIFSLFVFSLSFSQTKPTTFFNIKSVNSIPTKGTFLANPESKIKLTFNYEKIVSKQISLGDNLDDRYTLYFIDKKFNYKAVFFANQIKIYKLVYSKYKLIYDIETYETNYCCLIK